MRKHFLLLFLMALLPMAGWAQATDLSDGWSINFDPASPRYYTGADQTPAVKLQKDGVPDLTTGFNVTWSPAEIINAGSYTVTVTADNTNTYESLATPTKKFWILKANAVEKTGTTLWAGGEYDGNSHALITTPPTFELNSNADYAGITPLYSVDGTTWSEEIPTAKKPGTYTVYYKVEGNDNYNGIASVEVGNVTITGTALTPITDYTAPTKILGLAFQWNNGAAVEQTLIEAGTTPTNKGEMWYKVGADGTWDKALPKASAAGTHTVYWKVVGDEGYYDVDDPTNYLEVEIAKVTPEFSDAATAATGLVWDGEPKALLASAATATFGATPMYQIKAPGEADFAAAVAYDAVQGTAAGAYQIKTVVVADGNYNGAVADGDPIEVTIAGAAAFTADPTAANPTWNNAAQDLIVEGAGTVAGKVQYSVDGGAYSTAIPQGTDAKDYTVKYKVVDPNYADYNVEKTIEGVKINKKVMSIKVNNVKKTYDGGVTLFAGDDAALDGATEKFTFIGRIADGKDFSGITYAAIDAANKNAGTHTDVLTIATATLTAISNNYDYTIIPGTLTVEKKALTVTANQPLSAVYHAVYDISGEYTITGGYAAGENIDNVFATGKAPVLTTNAAAENPEPGDYTLAFTEGVLVDNPNYTVAYVIPVGAKFVVTPDASSKIVITVLPKTITYGDAEDYTNFEAGTDYYVTGLIGDDVLTKAPTFSRSDASNKNVGTYDLIAENAAVADPSKYPGGFVYNNSTIKIEQKEITVTVNPQTIVTGTDAEALEQLDQDAWSVEGLQYEDTKASLKGTVVNMLTPAAGVAGTPNTYDAGIEFNFDNANYKLAAASTGTGKLIVLGAGSLILDCSKADNATKIAAQDGNPVNVSIDFTARNDRELPAGTAREWKANTWNTLVLPFDITVAELSQKLGYAIVNVIDPSRTEISGTGSKFYGKLTMKGGNGSDDVLKANKPFMVKTADAITGPVDFGTQTIVAPTGDLSVNVDNAGTVKFTGTYDAKPVSGSDNAKIWFLMGNNDSWAYIGAGKSATWNILPFEGFIDMTNVAGARSMTFYFEEIDGSTTAIKSVSTDDLGSNKLDAKGWYNLNGMKMDGAPLQKGIYIKDGKKVVIK